MPDDVTDPRAELRAAVNRLTPWERNFLVVVNRQGLDMAWPDMGCRSLADGQARLDAIRAKLPAPAQPASRSGALAVAEVEEMAAAARKTVERDAVIVVLTDDVDDLAHRVSALERIMDGETLGDVLDVPISAVVTALARIGRGEARSVVAAIGDEQARAGASS